MRKGAPISYQTEPSDHTRYLHSDVYRPLTLSSRRLQRLQIPEGCAEIDRRNFQGAGALRHLEFLAQIRRDCIGLLLCSDLCLFLDKHMYNILVLSVITI